MDSFEFNKIAGAVLGTALIVFGLKELAHEIYHADAPEKPGMMIEVANAATEATTSEAEAPKMSMAEMLSLGNADDGPSAMKACKACHTWEKGGAKKTGPNLWNTLGRNIAAVEGFNYSSAFKERSSDTWTYEALDAFLKKTKDYIPKTKMAYKGISDDKKRADVILFMRSLSDNPIPLPSE